MSFPANRVEMITQGYIRDGRETCAGCGAVMEFWITPGKQKAIPMNPMADDDTPAISHFATCPHAAKFRKK
jgi:hypothetical protein